ncbi:MAG: Nif3-like dinuclear metal center hexameric protein [Bacteroidia bacterium]|nr:Nif3-like dinuclear metal center hexameric protein [Bacteroidia bacterium]MBT8229992.1 Nif3-like dinuclear metal center hexameric protein [Bacteroidia bacterium]NNK89429.1 Nif3-like dinuclear metal center hexameric protein [Saprospiraceae bacterium]
MNPTVNDIQLFLHNIAPNHFQESYDNSGLLVGNTGDEVRGIVVCLDSTEAVIDEAISLGANMVVAHHPIIFSGLKRITGRNYIENIVRKAIKNDINIFAIHTNLDNVYQNGVSTHIANKIGLKNIEILQKKEISYEDLPTGSGVIGQLNTPVDEMEFLQFLKSTMETDCVRYTNLLGKSIQNVALCGGSGRFLLEEAIRQEADIYISADFKYHEFFDANDKILIADIGHYESEQFTIQMLHRILTNKFNTFATHYTKVNTNPVNYL